MVRRADVVLILSIGLLAVILLAVQIRSSKEQESDLLLISVNGEEYGRYSLTEDRTIQIGSTNVCEIKDGQVRMTEANCPDKICLHEEPISSSTGNASIVCLPNRVVLTIEHADSSGDTDVIAR